MTKNCITLTFGDVAENHVGMQKLGTMANNGLSCELLKKLHAKYEDSELIQLNKKTNKNQEEAYLLIIRNGVNKILSDKYDKLYQEQNSLEPDKKALMKGRVVNKIARYNLCFSAEAQNPDYEKGKGTVIAFDSVPYTSKLKKKLEKLFKVENLQCEGNYYYDLNKCYIGYHGDTERRIVIGVRLGDSMPLQYQWFHKFEPVGKPIKVKLNGGDIYAMSEKATGYDWKKSSIYTLRHAAGADKYLTIKQKKKKMKINK